MSKVENKIKAVIFAGGYGTRITEETQNIPKPMIQIGNYPILWHIMKMYSEHGINEFIICCGYKGYVIKEYFANYFLHMSDVTFCMVENRMEVHQKRAEPWTVTLVDTGEETMTGGRLKRVSSYLKDDELFCLTYGDGVSDIDITKLIDFHKKQKTLATITAVEPPGRFGELSFSGERVSKFQEKSDNYGTRINGGFFVLSPLVIDLIDGDATVWEQKPLEELAKQGQISAFKHDGFWQCMDTARDKNLLEELWKSGKAPWKIWK